MRIILLDNCDVKYNQVGDTDVYALTIETNEPRREDITLIGDEDAMNSLRAVLMKTRVEIDDNPDY